MKTAITWPTVAIVLGFQGFILAMYKMGIISGPGVAISALGTIAGSLLKPLLQDKVTGGASIVPPTFDVPPVVIPPNDAPKEPQ